MNLNEFAKEVHENAIAHGWWGEEYTVEAAVALVHAEISEALESWRNNEPPVWYRCNMEPDKSQSCGGENCGYACMSASGSHWDAEERNCAVRKRKPEGFAAELIDVVLRILDAAAAWGVEISEKEHFFEPDTIQDIELPELIVYLHYEASLIYRQTWFGGKTTGEHPSRIVTTILTWLRAQNIAPEPLMLEKDAHNKTRPYKHGGKRV